MRVSDASVERAAVVVEAVKRGTAAPELEAAVDADELAVATAAALARLPIERQREVLATADRGLLNKVAKKATAEDKIHKAAARPPIRMGGSSKAAARRARVDAADRDAASRLPPLEGIELIHGTVDRELRRIPLGSIDLLVADPPWKHADTGRSGAAEKKYPCMPMGAIIADLVRAYDSCAKNAVFICWVSNALLQDFFDATKDADGAPWPWEYRGYGIWDKDRGGTPGMGTHERNDTELYLIYRKGEPVPQTTEVWSNIERAPVGEHSEKPEVIARKHVIQHCPKNGRVLELYAGRATYARMVYSEGEGRTYRGIESEDWRLDQARAELARKVEDVQMIRRGLKVA